MNYLEKAWFEGSYRFLMTAVSNGIETAILCLIKISFTHFGDGLRDALDPTTHRAAGPANPRSR